MQRIDPFLSSPLNPASQHEVSNRKIVQRIGLIALTAFFSISALYAFPSPYNFLAAAGAIVIGYMVAKVCKVFDTSILSMGTLENAPSQNTLPPTEPIHRNPSLHGILPRSEVDGNFSESE